MSPKTSLQEHRPKMGSIDPGCGPQLYVVSSVRSSTGSTGLQRRPQCARSTTETQRARTSPGVHEPIDPDQSLHGPVVQRGVLWLSLAS